MALSDEQIANIKNQLKTQVSNLPQDKKAEAESQIESLSTEAIEQLIAEQQSSQGNQKTIFRMIVDKEVESVYLDESPSAVSVLDINPISKGHILIIPKMAISEPAQIIPGVYDLAKKLSDKIMKTLKPKSVKLHTEKRFGEAYINLIPIYDKDLDISSPRSQISKEELQSIKNTINTEIIEKKVEQIKVEKPKEKRLKLQRRIP